MQSTKPFEIMLLDGKGGGRVGDIESLGDISVSCGPLAWIHLDYNMEEAVKWLHELSGVDTVIGSNLVDEDTRPRCFLFQTGVFLSLRGVNLNPGAEPDDMIAVRLWATESCVITSNSRRLLSLEDIKQQLLRNQGPISAATFIVLLIERLAGRAEVVIEQLEESMEIVEDTAADLSASEQRGQLSAIRRQSIRIRRYFAPQKEALHQLLSESPQWLTKHHKIPIRESLNRFNRYLEELDSIRDRAIVTQEELLSQLSETLNRRMYILSLVATFFLPMGFLTGLLGINVGGIPGADSPYGFLTICAGLGILFTAMLFVLKSKKWF